MQLKPFSLTEEDIFQINKHSYIKRRKPMLLFVYLMLFISVIGILIYKAKEGIPFIGLSIAFMIGLPIYLYYSFKQLAKKSLAKEGQETFEYNVQEEGIMLRTSESEGIIEWGIIMEFVELKSLFLINLSNDQCLFISHKAFKNKEERLAFREIMLNNDVKVEES